jgi:hypothetical protein
MGNLEGLRHKWDEPRDPTASLADPTLRQTWPATRLHGRHEQNVIVVGGDKFSGKTAELADVKTEIVSAIANAVFSYITEMDTVIFHFAGSGDHNRIKDNELEKHFEEKNSGGLSYFASDAKSPRQPSTPRVRNTWRSRTRKRLNSVTGK